MFLPVEDIQGRQLCRESVISDRNPGVPGKPRCLRASLPAAVAPHELLLRATVRAADIRGLSRPRREPLTHDPVAPGRKEPRSHLTRLRGPLSPDHSLKDRRPSSSEEARAPGIQSTGHGS